MDRLRLRFTKTGPAVYISHLDLMRTMQRAFLRGDIPLKYSEGFNPHAIISIALPLSVGAASDCELMDFKLREFMSLQEITYRLNRALPEGIEALECYEWERKCKEIRWLDIAGEWEYDKGNAAELLPDVADFFAQDSIVIEKKTKSGMGQTDIVPAIRSISLDASGNTMSVKAIISAQEPTLNPEHLITALRQLAPELAPDFGSFRRMQIYDSDMKEFR